MRASRSWYARPEYICCRLSIRTVLSARKKVHTLIHLVVFYSVWSDLEALNSPVGRPVSFFRGVYVREVKIGNFLIFWEIARIGFSILLPSPTNLVCPNITSSLIYSHFFSLLPHSRSWKLSSGWNIVPSWHVSAERNSGEIMVYLPTNRIYSAGVLTCRPLARERRRLEKEPRDIILWNFTPPKTHSTFV